MFVLGASKVRYLFMVRLLVFILFFYRNQCKMTSGCILLLAFTFLCSVAIIEGNQQNFIFPPIESSF